MRSAPELQQHLDQLVEDLKRYGAQKIVLFGSLARGDADAYSDIDLVVIKPTSLTFVERLADVVRRCPSAGGADILVYTPEEFERMRETENPFMDCVLRDGKVLHEAA